MWKPIVKRIPSGGAAAASVALGLLLAGCGAAPGRPEASLTGNTRSGMGLPLRAPSHSLLPSSPRPVHPRASPYASPQARARYDRTNAGHRQHAGVYRPPAGHRPGQPLSTPSQLGTLPTWSRLVSFNGYLVTYRPLTPFVPHMGSHWGHLGPSLVVLRTKSGPVVGAEVRLTGTRRPWYDPAPGHFPATVYTQHLYFVPPASIRPLMPQGTPSNLASWPAFARTNPTWNHYAVSLGPDPSGRAQEEGPRGPGLRALLDRKGHVVGLLAAWSASDPQGWRPWFDQPKGHPVEDPVWGKAYTQHLWLVDPRSLA
jgi:hypothetical protein